MQNTQTTPSSKHFFSMKYTALFPGRRISHFRSGKNLLLEKMHNQSIVVLVDSQAAIKSLIKCTVLSITVLNCIRNLNQLGKQNHVSIYWITGHAREHSNEVADYLAKSGSKSKMHGPEPFIILSRMPFVLARLRTGSQIDGNHRWAS